MVFFFKPKLNKSFVCVNEACVLWVFFGQLGIKQNGEGKEKDVWEYFRRERPILYRRGTLARFNFLQQEKRETKKTKKGQ